MCWEFFKTGLFAVGGGLATVPFLKEMSVNYGWFTVSDLSTMIAVSESTPGPIGINMATYIGNHMFGFFGGLATTLSLIAPSVITICIIARILEKFKDSKAVKAVFDGLRPAVVGFILSAVLSIVIAALFHAEAWGSGDIAALFNFPSLIIFALMLGYYKWKPDTHPILLITVAAAAGIILSL
jgi:chromate transporter